MKTNRLMTRQDARALDLGSRIQLEARIMDDVTDAKAGRSDWIPAKYDFHDYCTRTPWRRQLFDFLGPVEGRTILDLGCGVHPTPIYFAMAGAKRVIACDVSPKAVSLVRRLAQHQGVADRVRAVVCPAEKMPFDNEKFDLVHGEAVLHHLDLSAAGGEILRVMKKGAKAGFKDPLGQNPLLEFARDYLPYRHKGAAKVTDAPLRFRDIERFGEGFSHCSYHGFGLASMAAKLCRVRSDSAIGRMAHGLDGLVLRAVPPLHRFCQYVVTCVQR